jgi:hypothetical protein
MATITAMCTSFKKELLEAKHDFNAAGGSAFKIGLIKSSPAGTYGAATTNYTDITGNSDEASGTGYSAGGSALTNVDPVSSGTTGYTDFSPDITFSTSTITASGCFIYNTSDSNSMVSVHDFGGDKSSSAGDFTIQFPAAAAGTAIIRIA